MSAYIEKIIESLNTLLGKAKTDKNIEDKTTEDPAHDLGHASKCVWELDREA